MSRDEYDDVAHAIDPEDLNDYSPPGAELLVKLYGSIPLWNAAKEEVFDLAPFELTAREVLEDVFQLVFIERTCRVGASPEIMGRVIYRALRCMYQDTHKLKQLETHVVIDFPKSLSVEPNDRNVAHATLVWTADRSLTELSEGR